MFALQNDSVKFGDTVFCGSRACACPARPISARPTKKYLKERRERLRLSFYTAAKLRGEGDKLVAVVHYPAVQCPRENSLFTDMFEQNGVNAVVYGHLHGRESRADRLVKKNGIDYYLTSCDMVDNKLTEIVL